MVQNFILFLILLLVLPGWGIAQEADTDAQTPPAETDPADQGDAAEPSDATDQPGDQPDRSSLPKLENMQVPTVEELLTGRPVDWIVLNTGEVVVVDTITLRPNTLQRIQEKVDQLNAERRTAPPELREQLAAEVQELAFLVVTLPTTHDTHEYKLPVRQIEEIIHHEDLYLRRIALLLDQQKVERALELYTRLMRDRPEWEGLSDTGDQILFVDAARQLDEQRPQSSLMVLEELQRRNSKFAGLSERVGTVIATLVDAALEQEDFPQAQYFLGRLRNNFPGHPVYESYVKQLSDQTRQVLQTAAEAATAGDHREATRRAEAAARIWPQTPELRTAYRQFATRFQRLHVGVLEIPGDSHGLPVLSPAEERQQQLTELSLFQVDRVRDGTAFYRTRFFDEWEPRDLGREMRFTLRSIHQPYEIHAPLTTAEIAMPLLKRLDPTRPEYDERLAAYISSVEINSPTQFTLSFRRVPPRLEPLLARIRLTYSEEEPQALAPLNDPGGFRGEALGDAQFSYVRKRLEPDGLPTYHISEIVEHRYPNADHVLQALQRGEVSMAPRLPDWVLRRLQVDEDFLKSYFILPEMAPETHVLQFNPESAALRVRELRTALSYSINQERLLKEVVLRDPEAQHGRIVTTPYLSSNPARNVLVRPRRFDLPASLAMLLAAKRQLDGQVPPLTMVVFPGTESEAAAEKMVQLWNRIGLNVTLVKATDPQPDHWDILYRTLQMTDPAVELWPFLTLDARSRITSLDPFPDWLKQDLVQLDRTSDQSRAISAVQTLHRELWEDTAYIPLWEIDRFIVLRKNVAGFPQRPVNIYDEIDRWSVDAWYQTEMP